jgi:arylsulfatase A-like enzyme
LKEHAGYNADINDWGIDANSWVGRPYTLPEFTHPTNWVVTRSIDFLRRRDTTKPFFLWTSFVAPHPPLLPPTYYFDMYDRQELQMPYTGGWSREIGCGHPDVDCFEGKLDEDEIHRMRAGYYGLITHLDHQVGRLIRALKDEGVLSNTVILFTSDHGEMLGDHNMFRKSQAFEGSISIPMILFDPGNNLGLRRGRRVSSLVELRDVMPTLLEAAELPIPETVEGRSFLRCAGIPEENCGNGQGSDFSNEQAENFGNGYGGEYSRGKEGEYSRGKEGDCDNGQAECWRLPVSAGCRGWREYLHGEHTSQQGNFSTQFIVTRNEKYIWFSNTGEEMLFNLKDDPHELINLAKAEEYSENLAGLRTLLIKELEAREEGYSDGKKLYTGKEPVTVLK